MSIQFSTAVRNAQLNAIFATIGGAALFKYYSGPMPANCAAAATGTLLATLTLPATEENAASGGSETIANGPWAGNASAGGTIGYFRLYDPTGATCHMQGTVSYTSTAWAASTAVALNQVCNLGGNVYKCTTAGVTAAAGGPAGTGAAINDGTAVWAYQSAVGDMQIDNTSVMAGQQLDVNAFTLTQGNA